MNKEKLNPTNKIPKSKYKRIVIIGGGFAGMELAKSLIDTDYQVVMVDKNNYHTFQPLLYQVATATLSQDSVAIPHRDTIKGKNFFFRMAEVAKINPKQQCVETDIGSIFYDYLVIASGAKANFFGNEEIAEKAFTLKSVEDAFEIRNHIFHCFERAVEMSDFDERDKLLNVVIVGAGPTGVEMAGALSELKTKLLPKDYNGINTNLVNVYLIEGEESVLNSMSDFASEKTKKYLHKMGVNLKTSVMLDEVDGNLIKLSDGSSLKANTLIWAAGVKGNILDGIASHQIKDSRITTDEFNKVKDYENIYAIGDVAGIESQDSDPHPMLAPVAMQQGKTLGDNFKRLLNGKTMKPFKYFDKGVMATVGKDKAVVDTPLNIHFSGFFAWLTWMFVHLLFLIGFRRKSVVLTNWIFSYFTSNKSAKSIIGKS